MKILIAYDDSDASRAALEDLVRAGLPDDVEATVMTVETVDDERLLETDADDFYMSLEMPVAGDTLRSLDRALFIAAEGESTLRRILPHWHVRAAARDASSPADGILEEIVASMPDLVVVGSHHRSVLGRLVHGSVAQKVLAGARCSLRIGHTESPTGDSAMRIVAGVDGSEDSMAAIREIARRSWPPASAVFIVSVTNGMPAGVTPGAFYDTGWSATAWSQQEGSAIQAAIADATVLLSEAGLSVNTETAEGNPASTILEMADEWGADVIFLGAQGHELIDRVLLGSVSSTVVAHSKRAVEVVRTVVAAASRNENGAPDESTTD
jgi:nucleotide-binding universal stress UspA family protein